jgi:hypothetical protein
VIECSNADLILGRFRERAVRAIYINQDDGSYAVRIKSSEGLREVEIFAVKSQHERNRVFVRSFEEVSHTHPLKSKECF